MKSLISILLLPIFCFSQQLSGLTFAAGVTQRGVALSGSYYHQLFGRELHVVAGFAELNVGHESIVTDDIHHMYFTRITGIYTGVRLGNQLFIGPKLSYNWYGKHSSFGWGLSGGALVRINKALMTGLYISHDRARFDSRLDPYGPTRNTTISIALNILITS